MGEKLSWIKRKELGLPLGVWAAIVALVLLWLYRRYQANGGSLLGSSTTPVATDTGATSGGATDSSGDLAGISNEVALETQALQNVLDRLQGKKHKKPHTKKHHPKHHRAPHTSKTPVAEKHHRKKIRKVRPKHRRSSVSTLARETRERAIQSRSETSRSMGVKAGALRKPTLGRLPKIPAPELAHPRGEHNPNTEHVPTLGARSFTRGTTNTAKRNPNPVEAQPQEVKQRHPSHTKGRKH